MLIFALDTSGESLSAAVVRDARIICHNIINTGKTHSQTMMPVVDAVLSSAGIALSDVDALAVVNGPGSFTGIRIGVAAIKAMAHAAGKPCAAINSLDALAQLPYKGKIIPMLDARRGQVYTAAYVNGIRESQYTAGEISRVISDIAPDGGLFIGSGALAYKKEISDILGGYAYFSDGDNQISAARAALLAEKNRSFISWRELEPFYIRAPQAEREMLRRNKASTAGNRE